ncbi:MAG: hypothetical protein P0116_01725 [Candidatus Nitrosocosmicus sp.]|nr:hypothetical protein [Candidatus Nitrosocosmicus sp.]
MTIQDDNGSITADASFNQSDLADTIPPNNAPMSIEKYVFSLMTIQDDKTIDTTAPNETIDRLIKPLIQQQINHSSQQCNYDTTADE